MSTDSGSADVWGASERRAALLAAAGFDPVHNYVEVARPGFLYL